MEPERRVMDPQVLMEPLLDLLEQAESVPLVISGGSMAPFLAEGRDTVYLSKVTRPLKRGDMILFRRDSGSYILHRVLKVEAGICTVAGDAQTWTEPVRPQKVKALVPAVRRKGRLLKQGSFLWMFFEKIWTRLVPLRPRILAVYGRIFRK